MGKRKSWFVNGSINYEVVSKAAGLPGKALHVAIALMYLTGLRRAKSVRLSGEALDKVGVSRQAAYRALDQLESAGLVSVARRRGARPVVTLLGTWLKPKRHGDAGIPTKRVP